MRIAGIGYRTGATTASIRDALALAGAEHVIHLALPRVKAADPLTAALRAEGFDIRIIPDAQLSAIQTPTQSAISLAVHGTGSIAEACAIAATDPGGRLIATRIISTDRMATAAIAETNAETGEAE